MSDIPRLSTHEQCEDLYRKIGYCDAVALWATGLGVQSVELCLALKQEFEKNGHKVVLLMRSSAREIYDYFKHLYPCDHSLAYLCDDVDILRHLHFVKLLFTHDYTIGVPGNTYNTKICLFSHNANARYPYPGQIIDKCSYILSENIDRDFKFKYSVPDVPSPRLTVINCNPKFAILHSRYDSCREKKYICFYPTALSLIITDWNNNIVPKYFTRLIANVLESYPDYKFVLRPRKNDPCNAAFYSQIREKFANNKNFIYDSQDDNYLYLAQAAIFIGDLGGDERHICHGHRPARHHIDL